MLKDYEIDKPILETDRLIIRVLNESDVDDLNTIIRISVHMNLTKNAHYPCLCA